MDGVSGISLDERVKFRFHRAFEYVDREAAIFIELRQKHRYRTAFKPLISKPASSI